MLEVVSISTILCRPRYRWGGWHSTGQHWQRDEIVALKALVDAQAPLEKSADGLGRSPTSIAHRAYDTGLEIPLEWKRAIWKRTKRTILRSPAGQYPYITNVRGEYADLLSVNSLVPRGLPDWMRADVCQQIMFDLLDKRITLPELRAEKGLIGQYTKAYRRENMEAGGYAISLDAPMRDGRHWYDVLPG